MEAQTIEQFLEHDGRKELLRLSTAGSIDDGKSTLIGRLLHDSKVLYEDHIAAVRKSTASSNGEEIDYALFTDGLKAEREQGITIDVAYRYFSTPKRKFIIADTPGHEQYTRNMATGASTADLAIILIDARNGILSQTRRHAFISALLGVPHILVAVNKMDLVDYSEDVFERIKEQFTEFSRKLDVTDVRFVPISALKGDNVVNKSDRMPWYDGECLLRILENIHIAADRNLVDLRFPVQYVLRPHQDFRGYAGQMTSGVIRKGDEILVMPSMKTSRVKSIVGFDGEDEHAFPPMSITVTLEDEIDVSRGDVLVHRHNHPRMERHFEGMLIWMGDENLDPSRQYYIKMASQAVKVRIDEVRYVVDVDSLSRNDASVLHLNEMGRVVFTSMRPLLFDSYKKNRLFGSFIVVDMLSNNTVGAGMVIDREPARQLRTSTPMGGRSDFTPESTDDRIDLMKPDVGYAELELIEEVVASGNLVEGRMVRECEKVVSEYIGVKHAIACTSATTGLELALRASGVQSGDEVVVPDFTHPATALAIMTLGAHPVLVDVNLDTRNVDAAALEAAITDRTKAVIPVSIFGHPVDADPINRLCGGRNIAVIEDDACTLGAEYNGTPVGGAADIAVFSFHPRKVFTCGDGGLITTNNDAWAEEIRSIKKFGVGKTADGSSTFLTWGSNYRMSDIHGAVLLGQMRRLGEIVENRIRMARLYDTLLEGIDGLDLPEIKPYATSNYQTYTVYVKSGKRDHLIKEMKARGIGLQIGTYALHTLPVFKDVRRVGSLDNSRLLFENLLALPLHHKLSEADQNRVAASLRDCLDLSS